MERKQFKEILLDAHYKLFPKGSFCRKLNKSFLINTLLQITKGKKFEQLLNIYDDVCKERYSQYSDNDMINLMKHIVEECGAHKILKIINNFIASNINKKLTYKSIWNYVILHCGINNLKRFLKSYIDLLYSYTCELIVDYVKIYDDTIHSLESTIMEMDDEIKSVKIHHIYDNTINYNNIVFNFLFDYYDQEHTSNVLVVDMNGCNVKEDIVDRGYNYLRRFLTEVYCNIIDNIDNFNYTYINKQLLFENLLTVGVYPTISIESNTIYDIEYKDGKHHSYYIEYVDYGEDDVSNDKAIELYGYTLNVMEIMVPLTDPTISSKIFRNEIADLVEQYMHSNRSNIISLKKDLSDVNISHSTASSIYQSVMYQWYNKTIFPQQFISILDVASKLTTDTINKICNIPYFDIMTKAINMVKNADYHACRRFLYRFGLYDDDKSRINDMMLKIDDMINEYAHTIGFCNKLTSLLGISGIRVVPYLFWETLSIGDSSHYVTNPNVDHLYTYEESIAHNSKILFLHNKTNLKMPFNPLITILPISYDIVSTSKTKSAILSNFNNTTSIVNTIYDVCYSLRRSMITDEKFYNKLLDCMSGFSVYKNQLDYIKDVVDECQKVSSMIASYLDDNYGNVIYNGNITNAFKEIHYYRS